MSKYFTDEESRHISTYLEGNISDRMRKTIEYLISILGDVSLPLSIVEGYKDYFYSYGGRYDVRDDKESAIGLFKFYKKFPRLSAQAFDEISFRYIKDLFDGYELDLIFEKLIEVYGETDDAFEMFISYVSKKAAELQVKYDEDATKLDEYSDLYRIDGLIDCFISNLKLLVRCQHISVDRIIDCLPSPELVKKDLEQLHHISSTTRCFMGCGLPISYLMTESLIKGEDLSKYGERPSYYISATKEREYATFTTQEFIESVRKEKIKRLRGKK